MASLCGENCPRAFLCGNINVFVIAFRNIAKKRVRNQAASDYRNLIYFHLYKKETIKIVRSAWETTLSPAASITSLFSILDCILNERLIGNR